MMEVDAVLLGSGNGAFHRQTTAQTTCRHQASTDSLVENAGPVDTLPLFNRIAPNALLESRRVQPYTLQRESPSSLIGRLDNERHSTFSTRFWGTRQLTKTAQLAKIDTPPS